MLITMTLRTISITGSGGSHISTMTNWAEPERFLQTWKKPPSIHRRHR